MSALAIVEQAQGVVPMVGLGIFAAIYPHEFAVPADLLFRMESHPNFGLPGYGGAIDI